MALKLTALGTRGESIPLNISATSIQVSPDRLILGVNLFLRNSGDWSNEAGTIRFTKLTLEEVVEGVVKPEPKPTPPPPKPSTHK